MFILQPPEFLNSLTLSGIPPHSLKLKLFQPVILLRNINQNIGLCNGSRFILKTLHDKIIDVEIATGTHAGKRHLLPKTPMTPPDTGLPFVFRRLQFPIKPAFAITINKSQGQTLDAVGIYLRKPVFTHGQLYVALSRVTDPGNITIAQPITNAFPPATITNVVYSEILSS